MSHYVCYDEWIYFGSNDYLSHVDAVWMNGIKKVQSYRPRVNRPHGVMTKSLVVHLLFNVCSCEVKVLCSSWRLHAYCRNQHEQHWTFLRLHNWLWDWNSGRLASWAPCVVSPNSEHTDAHVSTCWFLSNSHAVKLYTRTWTAFFCYKPKFGECDMQHHMLNHQMLNY